MNAIIDKITRMRKAMQIEQIKEKKIKRNKYIQYLRLKTLYVNYIVFNHLRMQNSSILKQECRRLN